MVHTENAGSAGNPFAIQEGWSFPLFAAATCDGPVAGLRKVEPAIRFSFWSLSTPGAPAQHHRHHNQSGSQQGAAGRLGNRGYPEVARGEVRQSVNRGLTHRV